MSFFNRLLGGRQGDSATGTGKVAKERLKLVLEYDRSRLTPAQLELIRDEIIEVLSRHVEVASTGVQVTLAQGGRLVAEIPLGPDRGGHDSGAGRESAS